MKTDAPLTATHFSLGVGDFQTIKYNKPPLKEELDEN
jgi:hypothetical protein